MRWQEICITFPCYGTDWHRKRQVKTPFCRFESCTAHHRKVLKPQGFQDFFFDSGIVSNVLVIALLHRCQLPEQVRPVLVGCEVVHRLVLQSGTLLEYGAVIRLGELVPKLRFPLGRVLSACPIGRAELSGHVEVPDHVLLRNVVLRHQLARQLQSGLDSLRRGRIRPVALCVA